MQVTEKCFSNENVTSLAHSVCLNLKKKHLYLWEIFLNGVF